MSTDALPLPDLDTLLDDPATLRQLVLQLLAALQGKDAELSKLQHHLDLLLRRLYGRSSEKLDPLQQLLLDRTAEERRFPNRRRQANQRRSTANGQAMAAGPSPIISSEWTRFTT